MKTMSPICNEKEWTTYVNIVMKSEIHEIELVARMVSQNDVGDESSQSATLPEVVDEQHVECGVVITESASRPLVNFGVLNNNLSKGLTSCVTWISIF
jgi:hypothetical protein